MPCGRFSDGLTADDPHDESSHYAKIPSRRIAKHTGLRFEYTHPNVLVIDEVGYLTYGPDAANVLFHVVNDRHLRKRPMIFTTNKPLTEWGKVLHDEDMAAAILDRVLERGRFIHLDGPSGRTRHLNLEEVLPSRADRARISGIGVSEFPEPTRTGVTQPARSNHQLKRHVWTAGQNPLRHGLYRFRP